jgi:hypothetical protein
MSVESAQCNPVELRPVNRLRTSRGFEWDVKAITKGEFKNLTYSGFGLCRCTVESNNSPIVSRRKQELTGYSISGPSWELPESHFSYLIFIYIVFKHVTSTQECRQSYWNLVNNNWKWCGRKWACLKMLSRHLSGGLEENYREFQSRYSVSESVLEVGTTLIGKRTGSNSTAKCDKFTPR